MADVLVGKPHRSTIRRMDRGYRREEHGQIYEGWSVEVTKE